MVVLVASVELACRGMMLFKLLWSWGEVVATRIPSNANKNTIAACTIRFIVASPARKIVLNVPSKGGFKRFRLNRLSISPLYSFKPSFSIPSKNHSKQKSHRQAVCSSVFESVERQRI
jgi:hypothetical protein